MEVQQLDLFGSVGVRPTPTTPPAAATGHRCPADLADAALIAAIPSASVATGRALTEEAARRRLRAAIPALEALCRRFKGFGLHHPIPEQTAALQALAGLGGVEAAQAVRRLIVGQVVQGPALGHAVRAAASLRCRLPEHVAVALLRHPEPAVRADACRCAPPTGPAAALLVGLLDDLHAAVAAAAACALGYMARPEAGPALRRLLREAPSVEIIEAVVLLADEETEVLLGRIARQHPTLRGAALAALEDIDTPRAAALLERIGQ